MHRPGVLLADARELIGVVLSDLGLYVVALGQLLPRDALYLAFVRRTRAKEIALRMGLVGQFGATQASLKWRLQPSWKRAAA